MKSKKLVLSVFCLSSHGGSWINRLFDYFLSSRRRIFMHVVSWCVRPKILKMISLQLYTHGNSLCTCSRRVFPCLLFFTGWLTGTVAQGGFWGCWRWDGRQLVVEVNSRRSALTSFHHTAASGPPGADLEEIFLGTKYSTQYVFLII